MNLKDIVAIKGKAELFRVMSKSPKGIIVETLNDNRSKFKVHPNLQVLVLNDITIYPNDNNDIYLRDLFYKIYQKEKLTITIDQNSSPESIKQYFKSIAPNYDEERVYMSDMKKMLKWYKNIAEFYPQILEELKPETIEDEKQTPSVPGISEVVEDVKEEKPVKPTPKKKPAKPKQEK